MKDIADVVNCYDIVCLSIYLVFDLNYYIDVKFFFRCWHWSKFSVILRADFILLCLARFFSSFVQNFSLRLYNILFCVQLIHNFFLAYFIQSLFSSVTKLQNATLTLLST